MLTFLLSQGHVLATFTRNPKQATVDYVTKTPPQALATDLLQWGLALSPGNRLRVFGRRGVREATERYATSPDAWRQARRAAARREGEGTFAKMREEIVRRGRSPRPGYEPGTDLRRRIEQEATRQEEELRRLGFGDGTPTARNGKLQNYIDQYFKDYKEPGTIGNGATPDAIRYERATGLPGNVKPDGREQWHLQKGDGLLNGLDNWFEKQKRHPSATQRDKALASYMRRELRRAFKEGGVDVPR